MSTPTKSTALALMLLALGCENGELRGSPIPDQCMRRVIFRECLSAVPSGPTATRYNDWSEVVGECENAAYYQSIRNAEIVADECRTISPRVLPVKR